MNNKKHLLSTNSSLTKIIFILLIISFFSIFAFVVSTYIPIHKEDGTKSIIITADSLLTTSTITLIVFTNFSPSSSPSGSLMRRAYWRSNYITTETRLRHRVIWLIFSSWIKPHYVISITILTTISEVFIALMWKDAQSAGVLISLLIITSYFLFSALFRFIIFHLNQNKNTAFWLIEQNLKPLLKNSESIQNIEKSKMTEIISFFRVSKNYELLYLTIKKIEKLYKTSWICKISFEEVRLFLEGNPYRPDIRVFNDIVIFFLYSSYSSGTLGKVLKTPINNHESNDIFDIFAASDSNKTITTNAKSSEVKKILENILENPTESIKALMLAL